MGDHTKPQPGETVIRKREDDAFVGTTLAALQRGVATPIRHGAM